jgi:hypothetical protein
MLVPYKSSAMTSDSDAHKNGCETHSRKVMPMTATATSAFAREPAIRMTSSNTHLPQCNAMQCKTDMVCGANSQEGWDGEELFKRMKLKRECITIVGCTHF